MNFKQRFRAAFDAFIQKPEKGTITAGTTQQLLWMFQRRDKNLTVETREEIKKNPYVYAALRNTADELVGKWNGANGYLPRDLSEAHLRRPPQILAASDSSLHEKQANHLRWNIDYRLKRGWESVLRALLHAREDGKSVLELKWAWQPSGPYKGSWVIDDILHCDPDMFNFTYKRVVHKITGEVEFKRQMHYNPSRGLGGKPVPPGKFITFSFDKAYENEEGNSILNKLDLYDWYQRNNFIFWMVDLNRYGSPLLVGKTPKGASKAQREALFKAIESVQQETGIVISEDEKLEILQAQRNGAAGFELLNKIINAIIAVVITGNALSLEGGSNYGSYALAKATTAEIRTIILYALATQIDAVINYQLIYWFMLYNYPGESQLPRQQLLAPRPEESGIVNQESTQEMTNFTIPVPVKFTEEQPTEEDVLVEASVKQSLPIFETTWINPVVQILQDVEPEEILQELDTFEPDLDEYTDLLTRSIVTGHVLGRWQVKKEVSPRQFEERDELNPDTLLSSPVLLEKAREIVLAKDLMTKRQFERMTDQAKRTAFTIAGKESERIQDLVRTVIAETIQEGLLEGKDLEQRARETFRRYGVTAQTPFHAETVFRTNIQSALNDARWQMIQDPSVKSFIAYLQYVTKGDPRVRISHRKMNGVIRPVDDPVWQIWWPPNGYNCRCSIRIITKDEAERRGIIPTPELPNTMPDDGFVSGPSVPRIMGEFTF